MTANISPRLRPRPRNQIIILMTLTLGLISTLLWMRQAPPTAAAPTPDGPSHFGSPASQAIASSAITGTKVIAPPGVLQPGQSGVTLWHDYGSFALYLVSPERVTGLQRLKENRLQVVDWMNRLELKNFPLDSRSPNLDNIPTTLRNAEVGGPALHLVQFVGPVKQAWLETLEANGNRMIHYLPHNAYLIWSDDESRARLDDFAERGHFIQLSLPYQPYFKLGRTLLPLVTQQNTPEAVIPVVIQLYRHENMAETEAFIQQHTVAVLAPNQTVLNYTNLYVTVRAGGLADIARRPDVVWLEERIEPEPLDEVQGQIVAGNLDGSQDGPDSPGYLAWLDSFGFSKDPNDYPVVDIVDDGIGNGAVNSGDPTLHQFGNVISPTRLIYIDNCTLEADGGGPDGHGHINISIAGGYDTRAGLPFRDLDGYQRGLGINPYGRFAGTRIFGPGFDLTACGGTETGLIKSSQDSGAQITSNSWGAPVGGDYNTSAQTYDVGTRDADTTEAGNQPLIIVVAAGNDGPGTATIGSPGTAKNVITVGASESDRPSDEDGSWTDGCGVNTSGANDAMDIIDFSSRGPAEGGRTKPEIVGPGTHVQGTASTNGAYNGTGVCDQYRPSAQTTFAASSGTSHSTPGVAGVTSLYYYWLQNTYAITTPSPALMKAYLIAHPTYLTGPAANDTLPSNDQGYGMPNMSLAFDSTARLIVDQTHLFDNSGETWTMLSSVADPTKPVRIVLAYTDAAGSVAASPEVNDLNLEIVANGDRYLGNVFSGQWSSPGGGTDPDNNYEAIFLPAGTASVISMTLTAFNISGDGILNSGDATDQDFALVCYNCGPPKLPQMTISPSTLHSTQTVDTQLTQTLTISNSGVGDLIWSITEDQTPLSLSVSKPDHLLLAGDNGAGSPERRGPTQPNQSPSPPTRLAIETVADGSFEQGTPNSSWDEASTNFGTPICATASCGNGSGSGPRSGTYWVWFGGIIGVEETSSMEQTVTIPTGPTATLNFWLEIPVAATTGLMNVLIDGTPIFTVTQAGAAAYPTYTQVSLDVTPWADGASHSLRFSATTAAGAGVLNFFIDDISLTVAEPCDAANDIPWLKLTTATSTTAPNLTSQVFVTFDSAGLTINQTYTSTLCLQSNDPANPKVKIPVSLTVQEQPKLYLPVVLKGN